MSKSLGNVIDPLKVIQTLGADIIRLWVASVDYTADAPVTDDILKQVSEVYRKIRNTIRFMLGNLHGFDPGKHLVATEKLPELDRYMMARLNELIEKVLTAYNEYEFITVYNAIHNYCTVELSAFYLDVAKDALYTDPENSHRRRSIQTVLYKTLVALLKMLSPVIPHTTEEAWKYLPGEKAEFVQLTDMTEPEAIDDQDALVKKWNQIMAIRDDVLKALEEARNEKMIGKSLEAAVILYPTEENRTLLEHLPDLDKLFIVSKVTLGGTLNDAPENARKYRETGVVVEVAPGEKCERCWVISTDVGQDPDYPTLCPSCADTVKKYYA